MILRRIRKSRGYSQAKLSKLSKVHRTLISRYETGEVVPSLITLQKLASALEVPLEVLLEKEVE